MTQPTQEQLKEALRIAVDGLQQIKQSINSERKTVDGFYLTALFSSMSPSEFIAHCLYQIDPIYKELEEK